MHGLNGYLASKFMIDTGAGVIDADYRGVLFVLLFNHSDVDFTGAWLQFPSFIDDRRLA